ncbi:tRNA pseudouridine(55) synthase TruB [Candidatus Marinamargulisbacteria bacterium SCGC AG-414-C22]|nr:tRNA pseudouridine(55) synthase TruB [Candidatus Marinamargulisbacteria bacterium SCGC AG-414-C22]
MLTIMKEAYHGFLCVNKKKDMSSYDVIRRIKKNIPEKKIGHAGTLDPFAEGLLIIAIGRAYTKQISQFQQLNKRYSFCISLGTATDTQDLTGQIIDTADVPSLTENNILQVLDQFKGEQEQMPPQYSAKKVNGTAAYKLARAGKVADLKPINVCVEDLILNKIELVDAKTYLYLDAVVSKGTYIRTLSVDIAQALGTVGHTCELVRSQIGTYTLDTALDVDDLDGDRIKAGLFRDC